jgi:hypothetical protein
MSVDPIKGTPKITRVSVGTTETSHTFRSHLKAFLVRCQSDVDIRFAWESGETADSSDYVLLKEGEVYWEDDLYSGGNQWVIYLKSTSGTVGVSVLEWN